jgi:hypothetical protein
VAAARQPFLPGQVRSEALAARTKHHACAWVGVASMTQAQITADEGHDAKEEDLGVAYSGQCRIGLNVDAIVGLVRDHYIDVSPRTIAREIRIVGCTVIEHEYGHLAGLGHSEDPAQRHLLADGLHRSAMPQAVPVTNGGVWWGRGK